MTINDRTFSGFSPPIAAGAKRDDTGYKLSTANSSSDHSIDKVVARQGATSGILGRNTQLLKDLISYFKSHREHDEAGEEIHALFKRFLSRGLAGTGLHLAFPPAESFDLGPNWLKADLRSVEQGAKEAGIARIDAADATFDVVLCAGLNRVSRPASLISEIRRVLKPGGQVWTQVPLNCPYSAGSEANQPEFWRITPQGLRVLFERFDEVMCSAYLPEGSALQSSCFYYGLKPAVDPNEPEINPTAEIVYFPI